MDNPSSVIEFFFFFVAAAAVVRLSTLMRWKKKVCFCAPMRRHYWEYFGPLMFQQANRFQNADTRESLTAKHVFTFILLHAIMTCNCCIVLNSLSLLLLIICMDLPQHLYSVYYLRSLPPRLPLPPPPPRQRSFFGKQFEHQRGGAPHSRHNAGTKRY